MGNYIAESLGFPFVSLWTPITALVAFILVFSVASATLLKFHVPSQGTPAIYRNQGNEDFHETDNDSESHEGCRTLDVTLKGYGLCTKKRNLLRRKTSKLSLLKPIDTTFKSGILNIIIGPSGSGKTYVSSFLPRAVC